MRAILAGLGARHALARGGDGVVRASFPRACYLSLGDALIALVHPGVHPGPLYLVLDEPPPAAGPDTPVEVLPDTLVIEGRNVEVAGARAWTGPLPSPREMRRGIPVAVEAAARLAEGSALAAHPFRHRAARARELLRAGDLLGAARLLAGFGPGLTPAGDDALAGLLLALRAAGGVVREPALSGVAAIETSTLGSAFVAWAARGQALAPAHDLLGAAASGDVAGAAAACHALAGVGETSGADFGLGLVWGLEAAADEPYGEASKSR